MVALSAWSDLPGCRYRCYSLTVHLPVLAYPYINKLLGVFCKAEDKCNRIDENQAAIQSDDSERHREAHLIWWTGVLLWAFWLIDEPKPITSGAVQKAWRRQTSETSNQEVLLLLLRPRPCPPCPGAHHQLLSWVMSLKPQGPAIIISQCIHERHGLGSNIKVCALIKYSIEQSVLISRPDEINWDARPQAERE